MHVFSKVFRCSQLGDNFCAGAEFCSFLLPPGIGQVGASPLARGLRSGAAAPAAPCRHCVPVVGSPCATAVLPSVAAESQGAREDYITWPLGRPAFPSELAAGSDA